MPNLYKHVTKSIPIKMTTLRWDWRSNKGRGDASRHKDADPKKKQTKEEIQNQQFPAR